MRRVKHKLWNVLSFHKISACYNFIIFLFFSNWPTVTIVCCVILNQLHDWKENLIFERFWENETWHHTWKNFIDKNVTQIGMSQKQPNSASYFWICPSDISNIEVFWWKHVSRSKYNIKNGVKVFLNHLSNTSSQSFDLQRFLSGIDYRNADQCGRQRL